MKTQHKTLDEYAAIIREQRTTISGLRSKLNTRNWIIAGLVVLVLVIW